MNCLQNTNVLFEYAGLFRSEQRWIHPERVEQTYEIIYVTQGEVWLAEENRDYCLKAGQLLLLEKNRRHVGSRHSENVSFYWAHFHLNGVELPFTQRFFDRFDTPHLFKELLHYNNLPQIPDYLVNAILIHLLSELCRLAERTPSQGNERAEKIYEWIRINASANLKVGAIAAAFGYSEDHVSRICKHYYGTGAKELLDRFLIAKAKELLCNTELYVKEIAARLDFPSDKAFDGFFRYHEGLSPTEFRNQFSKIHMNNR